MFWEHLRSTLLATCKNNIILLTIMTIRLYIRFPELIHLVTEKFIFFHQYVPISLTPITIILFSVSMNCIYVWYVQYLFFSVWLTSLILISLKFIHVVVKDEISFFLMIENIPFYVCVCVCVCTCTHMHTCMYVCVKLQNNLTSQSNPEKEKKNWRHHTSWFQAVLQSNSDQNSVVLA